MASIPNRYPVAACGSRQTISAGRGGIPPFRCGLPLPQFLVERAGLTFVWALLLYLLTCAASVAAPRYERLQAGDCFSAAYTHGDLRYEARLRLLPRNFFFFSESFAWKKQPPLQRTFSGLWFQLQGGSLLWLHNRYGLSRPFNVGGKGALYADMPLPGGRGSLSVTLHPAADTGEALRLMGVMRREQGKSFLAESASGLVFPLAEPLPADLGTAEQPLFLELEARLAETGLVIEKVAAASTRLPSGTEDASPSLAEILPGLPWLLELPDGQQLAASFLPQTQAAASGSRRSASGQLDIAAPGVYLSLPVFIEGHSVRLAVGKDEQTMLQTLGLNTLYKILVSVQYWKMHGALLVFYDKTAPCCTLLQQGQTL